jgi:hypothetical protein
MIINAYMVGIAHHHGEGQPNFRPLGGVAQAVEEVIDGLLEVQELSTFSTLGQRLREVG